MLFCPKQLARICTHERKPCDVESASSHLGHRQRQSLSKQNYRISFSFSFCWLVKVVGNLIFTPTTKSPRSAGFLLFGMPKLGYRSVHVGPVGPPLPTLSCFPSMVCTVRRQPVRASLRSSSIVRLISSPSRVKRGWGFYSSLVICSASGGSSGRMAYL